jgi:putative hemolysin
LEVVTATDLVEALVGSLPSGASDQSAVQRPDGSWLLDGSLPIRDFKELLQLVELPGEGYGRFQTVAGFVIDNLGRIPSEGEMFTWEGYRFEVIDMDGNRIDKILVAPPIHQRGGREAA